MSTADLVIRARRVMCPGGERARSVVISGGRIAALAGFHDPPAATDTVALDDDVVLLPGLVDGHVHLNEPGRGDWEGFHTGTLAAAAGGVTTVVDMPLNSLPPTVDTASLAAKRRCAEGRINVDVGFWGGAVPRNVTRLRPLLEAGVVGVKCFLSPSGVDEFPPLRPPELGAALTAAGAVDGLVAVHAEDPAALADAPADGSYRALLDSRPGLAERLAVQAVVDAARSAGDVRVHIVHLSSAEALPPIARARAAGLRITVETCPHYLALADEQIPDLATAFKCCPPIRDRDNQDELWQALRTGAIDYIASDHSPCPPGWKDGDFATAWGGVSSLQLLLPVTWTHARRRGHSLAEVTEWLARRPARRLRLTDRGEIAPGQQADLCVFAPDEEFAVDPARLHHRHPVTPYAGMRLSGVVRHTWLRGAPVPGDRPRGRTLPGAAGA